MRVYAVVSEQMSDEATSSMRALTPSRRASRRILEGVGFVAFVYYGATRRVTEQQALFLADGLEGRYAASPVALRLAKRIREEAAARRGRDIELEDMEKYELLRFLDLVAFDRMLETELLELQAMLRGERRPGEPSAPPPGQG